MLRTIGLLPLYLAVCSCCDVEVPPTMLEHPRDFVYRGGDIIVLTCEATGRPEVVYTWLREGIPLNFNMDNIRRVDSGGSIEISPATRPDQGRYLCLASNQHGTAVSREATLSYATASVSFTFSHQYAVTVGHSLQMPCLDAHSYPPPMYSWALADARDDVSPQPLRTDARVQLGLDGTLLFANVLPEDEHEGKLYKCYVHNPFLQMTVGGSYSSISVHVGAPAAEKPELVYYTGPEVIGVEGEDVTLQCVYSGYPTPSVAWSREDGLQVNRTEEHGTQLPLLNLRPLDAGQYTCTGSNDVSSVTSVVTLRVHSAPRFLLFDPDFPDSEGMRPHDVIKMEGETASFRCAVEGVPQPSTQWFINGNPLDEANPGSRRRVSEDGTVLTVVDVCRDCMDGTSDLMVVQCLATNMHGQAFAQGYLNVLEGARRNMK